MKEKIEENLPRKTLIDRIERSSVEHYQRRPHLLKIDLKFVPMALCRTESWANGTHVSALIHAFLLPNI